MMAPRNLTLLAFVLAYVQSVFSSWQDPEKKGLWYGGTPLDEEGNPQEFASNSFYDPLTEDGQYNIAESAFGFNIEAYQHQNAMQQRQMAARNAQMQGMQQGYPPQQQQQGGYGMPSRRIQGGASAAQGMSRRPQGEMMQGRQGPPPMSAGRGRGRGEAAAQPPRRYQQ